MNKIDFNKTIREIEGSKFKISQEDFNSSLINRVKYLQGVKLVDFSIEDISTYLRQGFNLDIIVPLAIYRLYENLFSESESTGNYLLYFLLSVEKDFWLNREDLYRQVKDFIANKMDKIINPEFDNKIDLDSYINDELPDILRLFEKFKSYSN